MNRSTFLDKAEVKLTIRLTALLFFIPLMQSIVVGDKKDLQENLADTLFLNKLIQEKSILIYFLGEPLKEFLFTFLSGLMQGGSDTKAALITICTGRKLALNNKSSKAQYLALERTKQQIRLLPKTSFVLFIISGILSLVVPALVYYGLGLAGFNELAKDFGLADVNTTSFMEQMAGNSSGVTNFMLYFRSAFLCFLSFSTLVYTTYKHGCGNPAEYKRIRQMLEYKSNHRNPDSSDANYNPYSNWFQALLLLITNLMVLFSTMSGLQIAMGTDKQRSSSNLLDSLGTDLASSTELKWVFIPIYVLILGGANMLGAIGLRIYAPVIWNAFIHKSASEASCHDTLEQLTPIAGSTAGRTILDIHDGDNDNAKEKEPTSSPCRNYTKLFTQTIGIYVSLVSLYNVAQFPKTAYLNNIQTSNNTLSPLDPFLKENNLTKPYANVMWGLECCLLFTFFNETFNKPIQKLFTFKETCHGFAFITYNLLICGLTYLFDQLNLPWYTLFGIEILQSDLIKDYLFGSCLSSEKSTKTSNPNSDSGHYCPQSPIAQQTRDQLSI